MIAWVIRAALAVALVVVAAIGASVLKHRSIVTATPVRALTPVEPGELGRWVNPFIGSGGWPWVCGHNFPGAMVPLGMVRVGPETVSWWSGRRALNTSGYYYGDDRVLGFSHTRLNGTGATDGGHFLVVPTMVGTGGGPIPPVRPARFSHGEEQASPGYYAVRLPGPGILVELTATARVGVHRYTFGGTAKPHVLLDVGNALGGKRSRGGRVRVLREAREVEGTVRTFGTFAGRYGGLQAYFVARFDQPFATIATWQGGRSEADRRDAEGDRVGADLGFDFAAGPSAGGGSRGVTVAVALSFVSVANARANLEAEVGTRGFDEVRAEARRSWEEKLGLIRVEGGTDRQRTIFGTALYRVFQMPTLFNDANGEYLGFDGRVHRAGGFRYYTDLSLWDTFRTVHPLLALIAPADQRDMVVSLVTMLEQGGWLPRWPSGNGYSNSMLGTPADIVVADSYLKGIRGFDVEKAYEGMRRTALAPTPPGSPFSGREGIEAYLKHRYCPAGLMEESVSRTFEFGWADRAIAGLADALGRREDAALFREHSEYYRNLWNPESRHFQPRRADGEFVEPFKPLLLTYLDRGGRYTRDYVEGSARQWRWAAPYDAEGMISLFGSRAAFVEELEAFFAEASPACGNWNPGPYYWHGNQPDLHAAYLFNEAGRPDLTQKWVRWILDHKYGDGHDGLDGNDDGGTLSAWYVFGALGLYPVAGSDRYQLGIPLFDRAEVKLRDRALVIVATNRAPGSGFVRRVWLNDVPLDRRWVRHDEIVGGGVLRFELAAGPAVGSQAAGGVVPGAASQTITFR